MTDHKHPSGSRVKESVSAVLDGETNELELHRVLTQLDRGSEVRQAAYRYSLIGEVIRGRGGESLYTEDLSSRIRSAIDDEFVFDEALASDADSQSMAQQVAAAINSDSSSELNKESNVVPVRRQWLYNMGRVAVAASVTLAVLVGARNYDTFVAPDAQNSAAQLAASGVAAPAVNASETTSYAPSFARDSMPVGASRVLAGYDSKPGHMVPSSDQLARAEAISSIAARKRFESYMLQHAEQMSLHNDQGLLPFARVAAAER
ncbi:sigma-E factor negative regulatory protein [Spongorhabdus nitratireducens]